MKPILFLDINGVLNSISWFRKAKGLTKHLDPACVRILQRITMTTSCDIVIMSTWRLIHTRLEIMQALCDAGYDPPVPIIGETPRLRTPNRIRGNEVEAWLFDTHGAASYRRNFPYCCVDDRAEYCIGQPWIQTSDEVGLTNADADAIIDRLKGRIVV